MASILEDVFSSSGDDLDKMLLSLVGMPKKEIEAELSAIKTRIEEVAATVPYKGEKGDKGDKGDIGPQGPRGLDGKQGRDGYQGKDGKPGVDGKDGQDGKDGVSVVDAEITFDNSLVIRLSDGTELDAGQITIPKSELSGIVSSFVREEKLSDIPLFIQDAAPVVDGQKYLWIQTGMNSGSDFTFWFEDGK